MTELRNIIKNRDGITDDDFDDILADISEDEALNDPEQVLADYFCIEPDFVFDLFDELGMN